MLQHSLSSSVALRRAGTCILMAHAWTNSHKEPRLRLKRADIWRHQQEASENLNCGFLKKFWVEHDADIWQRPSLAQGRMHVQRLTYVTLLQPQVLGRPAIRAPEGVKNLQEYGVYTNDTNYNQIVNIICSLLVFSLYNLKLWLLYKGKTKPCTL